MVLCGCRPSTVTSPQRTRPSERRATPETCVSCERILPPQRTRPSERRATLPGRVRKFFTAGLNELARRSDERPASASRRTPPIRACLNELARRSDERPAASGDWRPSLAVAPQRTRPSERRATALLKIPMVARVSEPARERFASPRVEERPRDRHWTAFRRDHADDLPRELPAVCRPIEPSRFRSRARSTTTDVRGGSTLELPRYVTIESSSTATAPRSHTMIESSPMLMSPSRRETNLSIRAGRASTKNTLYCIRTPCCCRHRAIRLRRRSSAMSYATTNRRGDSFIAPGRLDTRSATRRARRELDGPGSPRSFATSPSSRKSGA